jgi:hypothetical protein
MLESIEVQAAEQLRLQHGQTMSLSTLHDRLVDELGPSAGTYHQLYVTLKRARQRFAVLERAHTTYAGVWPERLRDDYESALQGAGVDLSPVVTLVPYGSEDPVNGILESLRSTLAAFATELQADPVAAAEMIGTITALQALPRLRAATPRTTTRPRGPRHAR